MTKNYKILFLYSHFADYFFNCVCVLSELFPDAAITFVALDLDSNAPFIPKESNFTFLLKRKIEPEKFFDYCKGLDADLVFVSGWNNREYLQVARYYKVKNRIVIVGIDNPWAGSFRQYLACWLSPFFHKQYFTHAWVAGISQYEFVRRLGFPHDNILTGLYSANVELFSDVKPEFNSWGTKKKLLYVGRLVDVKWVTELCEVFENLSVQDDFEWELIIVGNGPLKSVIDKKDSNVVYHEFLQPHELRNLANTVHAFILPSKYEPWGVVVHEFAAAGLPLIVSSAVKSASAFVKDGYNGLIFRSQNKTSLEKMLIDLNKLSNEQLSIMGNRSRELSFQNTPTIWANTLMALLRSNA